MLKITDKDIETIKQNSLESFKKRSTFYGLDNKDIQIYCILDGFDAFLTSKGLNPGFELEGVKPEDSDPVDDSGLGEIDETPKKPKN